MREYNVLRATIELAAEKSEDKYGKRQTGREDWIPFNELHTALKTVAKRLNVSYQLEQKCYELLLLMSAESEKSHTWWEKINNLPYYLQRLNTVNLFSDVSKGLDVYNELPNPPPYPLLRLLEQNKSKSSAGAQHLYSVGTSSPSVLQEGEELSIILNHQTPVKSTMLYSGNRSQNDTYFPSVSFASPLVKTSPTVVPTPQPQAYNFNIHAHGHAQDHRHIDEEHTIHTMGISEVQTPFTVRTADNEARSRNNIYVTGNDNHPNPTIPSNPHANEQEKGVEEVKNEAEERLLRLSPILHIHSDMHTPQPHPAPPAPLVPPSHTSSSRSADAFSLSLRGSKVMRKYLQGGTGSSSTSGAYPAQTNNRASNNNTSVVDTSMVSAVPAIAPSPVSLRASPSPGRSPSPSPSPPRR
eukprot:gene36786-44625_t